MGVALVTGVDGFTGRYLVDELVAAGHEVKGLTRAEVDLLDPKALGAAVAAASPELVVHLAAISFVAHGDAGEIYRTNIVGTRNLLEALAVLKPAPRAVLLASSANIYGNATVEPITEDVPPAPANDYAVSKLAMEHMARLWMDKLPITIVRPFNYTGVGQARAFLLPKIVDHFRRKAAVLELGNLDVARDFSDVRTVVQRYVRLLAAGRAGETYNVASGRGTTLQEVLATMRDLAGHSPEIRVNPAFVRANEVRRLVGSPAKLDAAIGAVPAIELRDTLAWMLSSPA